MALILLLAAGACHAQGRPPIVGKVENVQMPVWVERAGIKAGAKAGWAIFAGDKITTGDTGRIELIVAGDARIKVSSNAALQFNNPQVDAAALVLDRGAFHMTAPPMARASGTSITVGKGLHANVQAGQVWAKVDDQRDLLVLLEGNVQIGGAQPLQMNEPDTVVMVPRGGEPQPVIPVAKERLAQWLAQTEPVSGRPTLSASGVWDVSLNSGYNLKELETFACKVQGRGFPSEIYEVREPGKQVWYRVMVRRFASREDALSFARLGKSLGSEDAWVLLPQP